jgi:hypothetical protein
MIKKQSESNRLQRQIRRAKAKNVNCLLEIVAELMDERKISMADIQRETDIPWATLHSWLIDGKSQILDGNIMALSKFFDCSINYLAFGIGEEPVQPDVPEVDQAELNKASQNFKRNTPFKN